MPNEPIRLFLKSLTMGQNRFRYGLDRTPDDRLTWSPGGEAPTPLQLAGKLTGFLSFLSEWMRTGAMPERPASPPPPPATREEAKERLSAAFDRMRQVALELSEADLDRLLPTPWRVPTPLRELLPGLNGIVSYFQGQLNYLQLAYGDTDPNIPPSWGAEEG